MSEPQHTWTVRDDGDMSCSCGLVVPRQCLWECYDGGASNIGVTDCRMAFRAFVQPLLDDPPADVARGIERLDDIARGGEYR